MRLDWTATAEDEKTHKLLFPDGKLKLRTMHTKFGRRRRGETGLLFTGTNRAARRAGAKSTRKRGH